MDYLDIAAHCKTLRKQKRLTQSQIAKWTGISRATINAFENGRAPDLGVRKLTLILNAIGYELSVRVKSPFPTLDELTLQDQQ